MTAHNLPVLVGVDGSEASRLAVSWAADEAVRRIAPLRLVHCYGLPPFSYAEGVPPSGWTDALRSRSGQFLAAAEQQARHDRPSLAVTTEPVADTPVPALLELSTSARLVVLGSAGTGGCVGLLLGSTVSSVAAHAHCPVAVVRERPDGTVPAAGHVLLGVDGGPVGEAAIAFEEAALRGAPLGALHAWSDADDTQVFSTSRLAFDFEPLRDAEERVLAERLAGEVPRRARRARPGAGQAEAKAARAQPAGPAVVVGSRGRAVSAACSWVRPARRCCTTRRAR
ncbi:nucleotide-binding universal stress UspA family protein [Amycolatopsis cihanbeyliensis]|uniref:Nucleotide-binding universal stress UspA family protein n=1 Tax=Amycolatopsis cihanbeyliensis TaxID=1128664 RepID=A0A542DE14_AMYCI|nr:nucleotide-binding universal stress UspA family protein [Amycolatopsis cihanbeyliensis]